MRRSIITAATFVLGSIPTMAYAGGFEIPDNGGQALGRGAAFAAKADDPTAIYYNVAGLARQRGTRLLASGNLVLQDYSFQRFGAYPDDPNDPVTPWGGHLYPLVSNQGGPFVAPFVAMTSDLGFDRFTVAVGAFGPSSTGNKTYPLGVAGAPSPSRYDIVQPKSLVILPTIAAAYRVTEDIDFGIGLHAVYGDFDLTTVSFTDIGNPPCKNVEYQPCDATNRLQASGWSYAASVGGMWRPDSWLQMGASVRTPYEIDATGTVSVPNPPRAIPQQVTPAPGAFTTKFPWVIRGGARVIFMDKTFETGDIELDATYETWSQAQGDGPKVDIPQLSLFKDIHTTVRHGYADTWSLRLGGAYNFAGLGGLLTVRAGTYYDSAATASAFTRMDFDTREKFAGTAGLGYKIGGFTFNVGYAEVFSGDRVVTDGVIAPINGSKNGQSVSSTGQPLPAVNNGVYSGHTRIVSASVEVRWDVLLGKPRQTRFGNAAYEDVAGGPLPTETKPEAEKPEPPKPEAEKREEKREEKSHEAEPKKANEPAPKPSKKPNENDWDK